MNTLLIALAALILGAGITFVVCYFIPKQKVKERNEEIFKEEQRAQERIDRLGVEYQNKTELLQSNYDNERLKLQSQITEERNNWELEKNSKENELLKHIQSLQLEMRGLEQEKTSTLASIHELEQQAKTAANVFKTQTLELAAQDVEKATQEMWDKYDKAKSDCENEYLETLSNNVVQYETRINQINTEIAASQDKLQELQSKVNAATEVNKRAELERNKKDFYRLILSDEDKAEIEKIRSITPYLRSAEPINKVIWKVYYEKPYTDLIGRVVGQNRKTGIYKITNIENQMCYVGQAVDIADRWKQHIKRGIGADPPTRNKLYPAMLAIGVENFTFEIIEECAGKDLNSREDYWQDFYHAKDFGYSIK